MRATLVAGILARLWRPAMRASGAAVRAWEAVAMAQAVVAMVRVARAVRAVWTEVRGSQGCAVEATAAE
eukprot:1009796-Prymnesium_polylepis.1